MLLIFRYGCRLFCFVVIDLKFYWNLCAKTFCHKKIMDLVDRIFEEEAGQARESNNMITIAVLGAEGTLLAEFVGGLVWQ